MRPIRIIRNVIISMVLLLSFTSISPAAEPSPGEIKGIVRNSTLDGKPMPDLEVILYQFKDNRGKEIARMKTGLDGSFFFSKINPDEQIPYYTSANYQAVDYFSKVNHFLKKNELSFDVAVYETTDQDKNIHIKIYHIVLEPTDETNKMFSVREIMIVENRGNKTYVGAEEVQPGKKETLRIYLPKTAENIQTMFPSVVNPTGDISDVTPISPGTRRVILSYTINPGGSDFTFEKKIHFDTDSFNFIYPDTAIKVNSDQLVFKGPTPGSDKRFSNLTGNDLDRNTKISIRISLPRSKNLFKWMIVGLVIILIGTGVTFSFFKGRKNRGAKKVDPEQDSDRIILMEQKQALLRSINQLDEDHQSGRIASDQYEKKRQELKDKAVEITIILKG